MVRCTAEGRDCGGHGGQLPEIKPNPWIVVLPMVQLPCRFRNAGVGDLNTVQSVSSFSFRGCELSLGERPHCLSIHANNLGVLLRELGRPEKMFTVFRGFKTDRQFVDPHGV